MKKMPGLKHSFYLLPDIQERKCFILVRIWLMRQENLKYEPSIFIEDRNKWFISESNKVFWLAFLVIFFSQIKFQSR